MDLNARLPSKLGYALAEPRFAKSCPKVVEEGGRMDLRGRQVVLVHKQLVLVTGWARHLSDVAPINHDRNLPKSFEISRNLRNFQKSPEIYRNLPKSTEIFRSPLG